MAGSDLRRSRMVALDLWRKEVIVGRDGWAMWRLMREL
jgi:hypothetical protein